MRINHLIEQLVLDKTSDGIAHSVDLANFPAWISRTVKVYVLSLKSKHRLYLVKPKEGLEFDQLTNILAQVEKKLEGFALLVADDLNPKYRPLFVKNNVPFVYKDKSLFAPKLGLKLLNHKEPKLQRTKLLEEAIAPFELKLLAGYLTGFIVREGFNLRQLELILEKNNFKCSKTKLAQVINHLIELEFVDVTGAGPNRLVVFKSRKEVWDKLRQIPLKPFSKTIECYYMIEGNYILSGETALSHYSDLAEPPITYLAVTNKQFNEIQGRGIPLGDFGKPVFICDVFKESPNLFAKDSGYLNPVELYFLLRFHRDERVKIAIDQMVSDIGVNDGIT